MPTWPLDSTPQLLAKTLQPKCEFRCLWVTKKGGDPDSSTQASPELWFSITCSEHSFLSWLLNYYGSEDHNTKLKCNVIALPVFTSARIRPGTAGLHEHLQARICCQRQGVGERKKLFFPHLPRSQSDTIEMENNRHRQKILWPKKTCENRKMDFLGGGNHNFLWQHCIWEKRILRSLK